MKKNSLIKILGITFGIMILLSWIIPAGSYTNGAFKETGGIIPIGLFEIFRLPAITIATFIQYPLVILAIGGFYGVLNKTGIYSKLIENVSKKWKGQEKMFLVITMVIFMLLASLTGLSSLIFLLVPLFAAFLLTMGYDKLTTFAATVGAMLVGNIGSTYGFGTSGYYTAMLELGINQEILTKFVVLAIVAFLFIMLVTKFAKLGKVKNDEIPLLEKNESKKSSLPFIVISSVLFILLLVGMYNWYYAFGITVFQNFHEALMEIKIGNFAIFSGILGSVSPLGHFGNYDFIAILFIGTLIIGWIYSIKFDEILDGIKKGSKEMLPTAFYAAIASIVFAVILNLTDGNFVNYICNALIGSLENFSVVPAFVFSAISSFFYNDFYTLISTFSSTIGLWDKQFLPIMGVILSAVNGLVMLLAPISIFLVAGLKYLEIPYKEWLKYIWKYALAILGIIVVISLIVIALI